LSNGLDGVPVQRIDLVAHLQQGLHRVRVDLTAAVLERIHRERVGQVRDHQKLAVRGHPVAVHPHDIQHDAEIRVGVLRQRRGHGVPEEQVAIAGNPQQVERVVQRHLLAVVAHVAQHRHRARAADGHQLGAHHPVTHAVPVDAAPIRTRARAVAHDAVCRPQVHRARARGHRHDELVHRIAGAQIRRGVGEDA
jgi:hypothetical protein